MKFEAVVSIAALITVGAMMVGGVMWYSQRLDTHLEITTYCHDMNGNHYEC